MVRLRSHASIGPYGELLGPAGQAFDALHHRYVNLANVNLLLAVTLLFLSAADVVGRTRRETAD